MDLPPASRSGAVDDDGDDDNYNNYYNYECKCLMRKL